MASLKRFQGLFNREIGGRVCKDSLFDQRRCLQKLENAESDTIDLSVSMPPLASDIAIYDVAFNPFGELKDLLCVVDEIGLITICDTQRSSKEREVWKLQGHTNGIFSASWSHAQKGKFATTGGDTCVRVWKPTNDGFTVSSEFFGHFKTVRRVRFQPDKDFILASGSRDNNILIWDERCSQNGKPVNMISKAHMYNPSSEGDPSNSVADIVFQDENIIVSAGNTDGLIKTWDIRKTYKCLKRNIPVHTFPYPKAEVSCKGYSCLCFDYNGFYLYAGTVHHDIFKFNMTTYEDNPDNCYTSVEKLGNFARMNLSADGRFLASGGESPDVLLWDTFEKRENPDPFTCLRENSAVETYSEAVSFNQHDTLTIATGTDDLKVKLWRFNDLSAPKNYFKRNEDNQLEFACTGANERSPPGKKSPIKTKFISFPVKKKLSFDMDFALSRRPRRQLSEEAFNVSNLLKDLPNFVINGELAHVHSKRPVTPSSRKKRSWLAEWTEMKDNANTSCSSTIKSENSGPSSPHHSSSSKLNGENTTPKRRRVSISRKSKTTKSPLMDRFVKRKPARVIDHPVIV